jgi:flavin-dependent dehydrogenase/ABC-type thiamine transport system ATPase subunit
MANVCRWMAQQAESLGVEIFPGMSCSALVWGDAGEVAGVIAGEFGREPDGTAGPNYEPGMELRGKYVFLSEGVRGSLAKQVINTFNLSDGKEPQKFGLGMKEIWQIDPEKHREGTVTHTMGWPLGSHAGGGSFLYHGANNEVHLGLVVHLNYANPHLYPYMEFQRFKHHPMVADLLKGGKRVAYGARAISEGGWQSIPKMVAPGVALLGCSAGLVNVPRIKGNHNAMLSGKAAAEAAHAAIAAGRSGDELTAYETAVRGGAVGKDLRRVRNVKPLWSRFGLLASLTLGGFDMWTNSLFGASLFGTLKHGKTDAASTGHARDFAPIDYPKPDGKGWMRIVHDLNLQLEPGSIACLLGPSGCGKSTVLRAICGFEPLQHGQIKLHDKVVSSPTVQLPPSQRRVGMVFQDFALFPHLSVIENVMFGLGALPANQRHAVAMDWLGKVSLADKSQAYPHELSGGQQQRVALARAMAPEPDLILLDEPFSSLDVDLRERLASEMRDI